MNDTENDRWNMDYFDELMNEEDTPDEVKKDVAKVKEKQKELKDKLKKKQKDVKDAIEKIEQFNGVVNDLEPIAKEIRDSPALTEPISSKPTDMKKQVKKVEVTIFLIPKQTWNFS